MFENKKKYAYWMRPSMVDEIKEIMPCIFRFKSIFKKYYILLSEKPLLLS